jgi:hypothetical protein
MYIQDNTENQGYVNFKQYITAIDIDICFIKAIGHLHE